MKTLFEGQPVSSLRPEESQLLWTQCWQSKRTAGVNLAYLFATDSLKATCQQVPEKLCFFSPLMRQIGQKTALPTIFQCCWPAHSWHFGFARLWSLGLKKANQARKPNRRISRNNLWTRRTGRQTDICACTELPRTKSLLGDDLAN